MRLRIILLFLLFTPLSLLGQSTAIVGARIHPVTGPPIENGVILMEGARITAVGRAAEVSIPAAAKRIDASDKVVTPGLIDVGTSLGLVEVSSVPNTRDTTYEIGDPVRAAFRVSDGLNPRSIAIPVTRSGGVTSVASIPTGGVISGQSAVIDLIDGTLEEMLVRDRAGMLAGYTPEDYGESGGSRGGLALTLREAFAEARLYQANQSAIETGSFRNLHNSLLDLEALVPVLDGRKPLIVRASRASDIQAVLRLAREWKIRVAILGGEEAWLAASDLNEMEVPVIVQPLSDLPTQFDRLGTRFDNASLLSQAEVPVVISTMDTPNARNLRFEAGNAVRFGMDWDEALKAVTLEAARLLGIEDSRGSLEVGKQANLVIWSGDPFEFSTHPESVFIRGESISLESRHTDLLERYRSLDARPVQYRHP